MRKCIALGQFGSIPVRLQNGGGLPIRQPPEQGGQEEGIALEEHVIRYMGHTESSFYIAMLVIQSVYCID